MSADSKSDIQLEIGHVLFMDVVGYSKLLIDEQMRAEPQRGYGSIEQFSETPAPLTPRGSPFGWCRMLQLHCRPCRRVRR